MKLPNTLIAAAALLAMMTATAGCCGPKQAAAKTTETRVAQAAPATEQVAPPALHSPDEAISFPSWDAFAD